MGKKSLLGFQELKLKIKALTKIETPADTPSCFLAHYTRDSVKGVEQTVVQSIFLKENSGKSSQELPEGRTLFCINLPVNTTDSHLETLFKDCGVIEQVRWPQKKPCRSCHIVFQDEESLEACLELTGPLQWPTVSDAVGVKKWLRDESRPDISLLKEKVDEAMAIFDSDEKKERERREALRNMPDEDGFVTVSRHGKKTNLDGTGGSVMALRKEDAEQLKPKDKGLVDFYRFQMRERKRQELADLRKKFEDDKLKIKSMKESRKFKPY
ncbi:hypothetical protein HDV03_000400 [Kappamyces sp. JEL0829]|nr:hypothetical protein HDV03_000400 [Kappamyces sp. JEL0829]